MFAMCYKDKTTRKIFATYVIVCHSKKAGETGWRGGESGEGTAVREWSDGLGGKEAGG